VAADQTPKIVLSYRRSDSAMAGRIFDRLAQHFGKANLFIDIDNVPFGVDFRKHIDDALQASDVLIAVVGEKWLGPQADGKLRINNSADPVRVELETALKRNITVLPVLLDGTSMPDAADLPEGIREFAYRNAIEVESGRDFNVHIDRLIRAMEQILGIKAKMPDSTKPAVKNALLSPGTTQSRRPWPLIVGVVGLLAAIAAGTALWLGRDMLPTAETKDAATGTAYCSDLKRVVAAAQGNFSSILGPEHGGVWTARIQLPGWDNCVIQDWTYQGKTTRYFSCNLPTQKSLDEVHAKRDAVDAYLQPCLAPDWIRRRTEFSNRTTDTNFELGQDDPIVRIRESYYQDTQEYVLRLDVDAPQSAAAKPPT
jgi:hypothetical protein